MFVANDDGTSAAPLLPCDDRYEVFPRWSPDGKEIAYEGWAGQVDVVNADGTNLRDFVYDSGVGTQGFGWSPDGTRLTAAWTACPSAEPQTCYGALDVVNVSDGSGGSVLGPSSSTFPVSPDWSPDGSRIAFGMSDLNTIHPDGTAMTAIGTEGNEWSWSPDARKILYWKVVGGNRDIYVVNADGSGESRLTTDPASDETARWSPDGTKIVFSSNRDGDSEIFVMRADGTAQTALTSNTVPDWSPDWQPLPINSYPRPKGATPTQVSMVPAYAQCTAPSRTHGPPLAFPSCASPALASDELTVGTADSNGKPTKSRGLVRYDAIVGNPSTPADEADVKITVELSDIYRQGTLADYTGELRARTSLRITDKLNTPHPGGPGAATVSDASLGATVPCTATAETTEGASCNLLTTFDALAPGTVTETKRSIWALGAAQLDDGGVDNDADTPGDNTLFLTQGIFIP